jgi:hypothetical protein
MCAIYFSIFELSLDSIFYLQFQPAYCWFIACYSSTLKMEWIHSSKTQADTYRITQHYNPPSQPWEPNSKIIYLLSSCHIETELCFLNGQFDIKDKTCLTSHSYIASIQLKVDCIVSLEILN